MSIIYIELIGLSIIAFITSLLLAYYFKNYFSRKKFVGIDMFKINHPKIPLLGGLSIPITLIIFSVVGWILGFLSLDASLSIFLVIFIILAIGLVDDFMSVPGVYKPLACILGGLPLIFFYSYNPHLFFPLGVGFRIAIIYTILILIGVSVSANTVNMLDVINGSVAMGGIIVLITMFSSAYIIYGAVNPYLFLIGIMALAGFYFLNKYPAKTFLGNAPALVIGGYIATLAVMYKIEFPTVVSMFPFIHNSFFFLNKIKGFVEHKKLPVKVTRLNEAGYIEDAEDVNAPVTLLRFLVSDSPLNEKDAFINMVILFIVSSFLAIIYAWLMR